MSLLHEEQDLLGGDYRARTFAFANRHTFASTCRRGTGPVNQVHTTLVHHVGNPSATKAILYVHGYTDYFFQTELAEHLVSLGYRFYAIDLQGYGRSIRPFTPPNWCDSIDQYQQDLNIALATLKHDGITDVVMLAHSTGGLIVSNYLAQRHHNGLPTVRGLMLNSPFLALPFPPKVLKRLSWPIRTLVGVLPFSYLRAKKITLYAQSIHHKFGGEWHYRLDWKPAQGFDLSFHWLKEVIHAQRYLANQRLHLPTLLCRSNTSTIGKLTVAETQQGDGVLDVDSMQAAAETTFTDLTQVIIPQGFHDLALSALPARQTYYQALTDWLHTQESAQGF